MYQQLISPFLNKYIFRWSVESFYVFVEPFFGGYQKFQRKLENIIDVNKYFLL